MGVCLDHWCASNQEVSPFLTVGHELTERLHSTNGEILQLPELKPHLFIQMPIFHGVTL